ncbi:MAG: prolyl oligopeptidase family serine peptidase [Deltaproteobacteria bacterium]|nr:prolyl oligopeptidase family serine peptidase [Deltaproteobacteria bacterium]
MNKLVGQWNSERLQRAVKMVRWGHGGVPVLLFPTAGGDAEEVERFLMMKVLGPLIDGGRIRVYSCDNVAGKAMIEQEGSPQHRQWVLNQYHQYVRYEAIPAIRMDCRDADVEVIAAGASIGAFHASAMVCRFPDVFRAAIAMSGTYDLRRFFKTDHFTQDYFVSSPLAFAHSLSGPHLDKLRTRFVLMPSGEGRAEDISESWALARALGAQRIPNRVDSWGKQTPHDWVTWREMLPKYLSEMVG